MKSGKRYAINTQQARSAGKAQSVQPELKPTQATAVLTTLVARGEPLCADNRKLLIIPNLRLADRSQCQGGQGTQGVLSAVKPRQDGTGDVFAGRVPGEVQ